MQPGQLYLEVDRRRCACTACPNVEVRLAVGGSGLQSVARSATKALFWREHAGYDAKFFFDVVSEWMELAVCGGGVICL